MLRPKCLIGVFGTTSGSTCAHTNMAQQIIVTDINIVGIPSVADCSEVTRFGAGSSAASVLIAV